MIIKNKSSPLPRLIIFIFLSLLFSILISLHNSSQTKNSLSSKAQTTCNEKVTGNEQYENEILPIGSHLAANNSPNNYKQIRELYNCQNSNSPEVKNRFIPVVVVYDLFFLKGGPSGIRNNLEELRKYGLYPIIRIASYMGKPKGCISDCWIKLYTENGVNQDIAVMAKNLSQALNAIKGFPQKPIVVFFNEENLHEQWEGKTNPSEFAKSFAEFLENMGEGNFQIFFPAMSYGWTPEIGISPAEFLGGFFDAFGSKRKIDGVDLNIYGETYTSIAGQYQSQLSAFDPYLNYFNTPLKTAIGELGPVRNGEAVGQCHEQKDEWEESSSSIISEYLQNPLTIATMGCFGANTLPAIAHYDETQPLLINLEHYGQISNNEQRVQQTAGPNTTTKSKNNSPLKTTITFDPVKPKVGDTLKIIISANQGMVWVNLAGTDPAGIKINLAGTSPKTLSDKNGFSWTYSLEKIVEGPYTFVFSDNCHKYNKSGLPLKDVCDQKATAQVTVAKGAQTKDADQNAKAPSQKEQVVTTLNIPSPGKIMLDISTIDPIDPYVLEYCKKPQTSNADCINPHDQVVENGTVTMSFPDGNPAIFCGSIPEKRRNEVNKSDRSCVIFSKKNE